MIKARAYMCVLALLPLSAAYLLFATLRSVIDARPLRCVILALTLVLVIFAELAAARSWRVGNGLFAFQAILVYRRFRRDETFLRHTGEERVLKYLRGIPGLEDRADEATALALFKSGEKILSGRPSGKGR